MDVANGVSPSRRYRVSMMAEDETQVQETVTLPASLPNNPATVEIWYQKYIPKGQLIVDIEPAEAVEEPIVEESTADPKYVGYGDSLEYIGEDEPTEEESEEDDNGDTFVSDVEDSPKGGY